MKKETLKIMVVIIFFIFAFTPLSSGSGIKDDRLINTNNTDKPELNNSMDTVATVTVSSDVSVANGTQPSSENNTVTPGSSAKAIATGYIQSGKSEKEVVSGLVELGYTQTEAEIAYSKASVNTATETAPARTSKGAAEPENAKDNQPVLAAVHRVAQGVGTQPARKFRSSGVFGQKQREKEAATAKDMLSEGYSITDIAQGFMDNGYNSEQVIGVFKSAGVGADDTFNAVSSILIDKVEGKNKQSKPSAKFKRINGSKWESVWSKRQEEQGDKIKQAEIKGLVEQMVTAGYDIKPALGGIVQQLKDAGMSAGEVKDYLIGKVSDIKPKAKFNGHRLFGSVLAVFINFNKTPTMESFGEGETALATAMLQSGYSREEVQGAFENKRGNFYGSYSYTSGAIAGIISAAENTIKGTNQPQQTTNTNTSTKLESDILKRATTPLPI